MNVNPQMYAAERGNGKHALSTDSRSGCIEVQDYSSSIQQHTEDAKGIGRGSHDHLQFGRFIRFMIFPKSVCVLVILGQYVFPLRDFPAPHSASRVPACARIGRSRVCK
jgi:hypothetical protein